MPQAGIEPTTLALGVLCSILLSYWGAKEIIPNSCFSQDSQPVSAFANLQFVDKIGFIYQVDQAPIKDSTIQNGRGYGCCARSEQVDGVTKVRTL